MNNIEDEQFRIWSEQIRNANQDAFNDLFRYLYPKLVRFAMRYTKQKEDACDIVQDTFVILWRKMNKLNPDQSLQAYLFKIVKNRSINFIKKRVNKMESLDQQSAIGAETDNVYPNSDDSQSQHDITKTKFQLWIAELPERQREAFELSRFDGLNHDEIADVMEVSPKTVNNHIVSALQALRERYDYFKTTNNEGSYE